MRVRQLFDDRLKADYEPQLLFPHSYSTDSLKRASTTIRDFESLRDSPTGEHLLAIARSYADEVGRTKH
jgi:hypothetical protein